MLSTAAVPFKCLEADGVEGYRFVCEVFAALPILSDPGGCGRIPTP